MGGGEWGGAEGHSRATTTSQTSGNSRKKLHASNQTTKLSMSLSTLLASEKFTCSPHQGRGFGKSFLEGANIEQLLEHLNIKLHL